MNFGCRKKIGLKLAVLVTGSLSGISASAHADGNSLLLLGVVRNGHHDSHLSARLAEHLEHVGEPILKSARIGSIERLCADGECMDQAARREGADHVMTVQITADRAAPPFLRLALLDTQSHRLINKEGICDPCSGDAMGLTLESLTDRAFAELRQPPAPAAPPPPAMPVPELEPARKPSIVPYATTAQVTSHPTFWQRLDGLPRERKIGAGVLGGVAVAALITSIGLAASHHQYTSLGCTTNSQINPSGSCRLDNTVPMSIGFSVSIVAAAGGLGFLLWPVKETPRLVPSNGSAAAQEN